MQAFEGKKKSIRFAMFCGVFICAAPALAVGGEQEKILITMKPDRAFSAGDFDLAAPAGTTPGPTLNLAAMEPRPPAPDVAGPARALWNGDGVDGDRRYRSFGSQAWSVKWEYAAVFAEITAIHIGAALREGTNFSFENEGWLGRDTANLGVDKFTHAFNTYLATELLQWRIARKTNNAPGNPLTAGILAMSLVAYSEFYDGIEPNSGWSWQDMTFNLGGAALSVLRHSVPGLKDKLDFRMMVVPNHDVITFTGKEHFRQQRFLLALQLSGFERLEHSPLRFVELHAGYYATGFTDREKAAGRKLDRRPFIGIGLNLQQLLFPDPRSLAARIGHRALDYAQVPYTAAHIH